MNKGPLGDFRHLFRDSLAFSENALHFAAHSHHLWPDCTRGAQDDYWRLSAQKNDRKWETVFNEALRETRQHIARHLQLSDPEQIALAPNTHELAERLLSAFIEKPKVRVLTTDQEFHSFRRQIDRYEELPHFEVDRLSVEPFETFEARLLAQLRATPYDVVFLSHVFYSSGFQLPSLEKIVAATPRETHLVIDGYHAFFAQPVNLSAVENRLYYLAGGYKYAMSGEGICFLHVPKNCSLRPLNTGWFAEFEKLSQAPAGTVAYPENGMRFAGATFDPLPSYRFNAVMRALAAEGLSVDAIHAHIEALKNFFIARLRDLPGALLSEHELLRPCGEVPVSHFLTFQTSRAPSLSQELQRRGITVDVRGNRLRVGFGLYHSRESIEKLIAALAP